MKQNAILKRILEKTWKRKSRAIENSQTATFDKAKHRAWKNETAESCT